MPPSVSNMRFNIVTHYHCKNCKPPHDTVWRIRLYFYTSWPDRFSSQSTSNNRMLSHPPASDATTHFRTDSFEMLPDTIAHSGGKNHQLDSTYGICIRRWTQSDGSGVPLAVVRISSCNIASSRVFCCGPMKLLHFLYGSRLLGGLQRCWVT